MTNKTTLQAIYRAFDQKGVTKITPHPKVMDALLALIEREKRSAVSEALAEVCVRLGGEYLMMTDEIEDAMFPNAQ